MNDKTMLELKHCPCGATPTALNLSEGSTYRWGYASGNCCSQWEIEFRTKGRPNEPEYMQAAIDEWNLAPRATLGQTLPPKTGA